MKNLLLYLNILQIEEYQVDRFISWVKSHPNPKPLEGKKPIVWTLKLKLVYWFSLVVWPVTYFWPWIGLAMGTTLIHVFERWVLEYRKKQTKLKIAGLKKTGLRVVGISGSFGKTSTKEVLYTLLQGKYRVYRTPESFNTVKGIVKAVDLELDEGYEIFICEMGEYKPGDVKELCEMVDPDMGIVTGVNEQHGERMGGVEKARATVLELADWVATKNGLVVVNGKSVTGTGYLEYGKNVYRTPLEQNVEGAGIVAAKLGITPKEIKERTKLIKPVRHRLEVKKHGELTILDDTYNSNPDGFAVAITYLGDFSAPRVVVTPGIVELGSESGRVHRELGTKMTGVVDLLVLVGKNERTEALVSTFKGKCVFVSSVNEWRDVVSLDKGAILFENDLPDNY